MAVALIFLGAAIAAEAIEDYLIPPEGPLVKQERDDRVIYRLASPDSAGNQFGESRVMGAGGFEPP